MSIRQLSRARHMAAVTQLRNDTPGGTCYQAKIDAGKSMKEVRQALEQKMSDAVDRHLRHVART